MLVLTRKKLESIVIYHPDYPAYKAVVQVVEIKGDKIRLGVTADKAVVIHRQEVQDLIHRSSSQEEGPDARRRERTGAEERLTTAALQPQPATT